MKVHARFEHARSGVVGATIGPFEFMQLTYNVMLRDDRDHEVAINDHGEWKTLDGARFTDVIFFAADDERPRHVATLMGAIATLRLQLPSNRRSDSHQQQMIRTAVGELQLLLIALGGE